jgi:hypothetical protein
MTHKNSNFMTEKEEKLMTFAAKYGNEALKEVLSIISDVKADVGVNYGNDTKGIVSLIEKGTGEILKERDGQ